MELPLYVWEKEKMKRNNMENILVSIIIPVHNEEEILNSFFHKLEQCSSNWSFKHEFVIVNDGSTDNSAFILDEQASRNSKFKVIHLTRNFGQQEAISAGLTFAEGDCVYIIDADGQDPPEQLINFLREWQKGYNIVYGMLFCRTLLSVALPFLTEENLLCFYSR